MAVLHDSATEAVDKLILFQVMSFDFSDRLCIVSYEYLANNLGVSWNTVHRSVNRLEAMKWLDVKRTKRANMFTSLKPQGNFFAPTSVLRDPRLSPLEKILAFIIYNHHGSVLDYKILAYWSKSGRSTVRKALKRMTAVNVLKEMVLQDPADWLLAPEPSKSGVRKGVRSWSSWQEVRARRAKERLAAAAKSTQVMIGDELRNHYLAKSSCLLATARSTTEIEKLVEMWDRFNEPYDYADVQARFACFEAISSPA